MKNVKIKNSANETVKAGCIVMNDKNEVLLVSEPDKIVWTYPKGHAENGENVEDTAKREVFEETGYKVQIIRRLSDVTYAHGKTGELIRVAMFLAHPLEKLERAESNIKLKWFSLDEAKETIYPSLAFLLNELI
jgi:ADP-ribose pyrophosphatase YjhB (NUDIX family)